MAEHQADFVRGAVQTLKDGVVGATHTIGTTHLAVLDALPDTGVVGGVQRYITEQVYRLVLGSSHVLGWVLDAILARLPPPGDGTPVSRGQLLAMSSINGAFGDFLARHDRLWSLRMQFCRDGLPLPVDAAGLRERLPDAKPHLIVFIHGLCLHDRVWEDADGDSFGRRWEDSEDATCVYLRYNTGRHIHDNGERLAEQLERLRTIYPVALERLTIVGHSMGGLVARSACSYAAERNLAWLASLKDLACLGSPHEGAPLERIGFQVTTLLGKSPITYALGRAGNFRSAGIKDLRYGCLRHEDWEGCDVHDDTPAERHCVPLIDGVRYCFLAAAWMDAGSEVIGDGLVPVSSALGERLGDNGQIRRPVIDGVSHLALPRDTAVFGALNVWLFTGHPDRATRGAGAEWVERA